MWQLGLRTGDEEEEEGGRRGRRGRIEGEDSLACSGLTGGQFW